MPAPLRTELGIAMKTDLSRSTFDAAKRFSSVRLQQGRMQLDADWNEQIDILAHHDKLTLTDMIGPAGGPLDSAGFGIAGAVADLDPREAARPANQPVPTLAAGDFLITGGTYYASGLLAQNPAITSYLGQEDFPDPPALTTPGVYLAYLDVWDRSITALEDPSIREVALGGPDTATRTRRIWQVRAVRVAAPGATVTCMDEFDAYAAATRSPDGQLSARAEPGAAPSGPCVVPETAGYRSLENQLYRVEVHTPGTRAAARFKWSRENGAVVSAWLGQNGDEATISSAGPDRPHGFSNGDWVELIDASRELRGAPGTMVRLLEVRADVLVFDPATADGPTAFAAFPSQPRIRRWEGTGLFAAPANAWVDLEQGVQVRFQAGTYRTGDYWMIPARTNTGAVEWPVNSAGTPVPQSPHGIVHAYARLGLMQFDGTAITATEDCRTLFPPLTGLMQIDYAGGDGQEAMPDLTTPAAGAPLPEPLRAAVSLGGRPVAGATVRFSLVSGGGRLNGASAPVDAVTDAEGVASTVWRLGAPGSAQRVEARLLDHGGTARHVPLVYSASHAMAATTAFDPANCPPLAQARNVQEALELLCARGGGEEPGFRIERMIWRSGQPFEHDGRLSLDMIMEGLEIICDDEVDPASVGDAGERPVAFITAMRPDGGDLFTFEIRLSARLSVAGNVIIWQPNPNLPGPLIDYFRNFEQPALFELTVRGDNIRARSAAEDGSVRWLDADALERPGRQIMPTGDTRRGGTLVSWFWIIAPDQGRRLRFVDVVRQPSGGLIGRVVLADSGAPVFDVEVALRGVAGNRIGQTQTNSDGGFLFADVPSTVLELEARSGSEVARMQVPAIRRQVFRPEDFAIVSTDALSDLSSANRARLRATGLTNPADVANLSVADLAGRLDISERLAETLLNTVRAAARPR
ncbi:MAG: carboxypeptidase regulatory-like domain-containing protein [Rhodobacteraceae bacterium]|nr:MAG: carboxypeptidase regulatory-like domain-containing protein [Paracoccaceae bacterium]